MAQTDTQEEVRKTAPPRYSPDHRHSCLAVVVGYNPELHSCLAAVAFDYKRELHSCLAAVAVDCKPEPRNCLAVAAENYKQELHSWLAAGSCCKQDQHKYRLELGSHSYFHSCQQQAWDLRRCFHSCLCCTSTCMGQRSLDLCMPVSMQA